MNKNLIFLAVGGYLLFIGISYFLIFFKHHKRNKVQLDEIIELVTEYFTITTCSIFLIGIGMYLFIIAAKHRYDLEEVIKSIILGIFIISATILNYINYIKKKLKDYDQEIREENRKKNIKIGEILELILFSLIMLLPIYKIPTFIMLKDDRIELFIEIGKAVAVSIASMFLLYNLNPLGIREKLFKKKKDMKVKENEEVIDINKEK